MGSEQYSAFNPEKVRRLDCTSCGEECAASCGTKLFRTCCLSFARKRSEGFAAIDDIGNESDEEWRSRNFMSLEDSSTINRLQLPYVKILHGQPPRQEWGGPKAVKSLLL